MYNSSFKILSESFGYLLNLLGKSLINQVFPVWFIFTCNFSLIRSLLLIVYFTLPSVEVMCQLEEWPGQSRMTECFLPPSSSPAEQRRAEHPGGVARTPSSEEISPTKFPGLYRTGEPSPPHDGHHHEAPDAYVSDDDKEHSKKKNKFKKKEKRSKKSSCNLTPNV